MKLEVAAARVVGSLAGRINRTKWIGITVALAVALCAGTAIALDGIDLSEPAAEVGAGECPRLIQIKYPFLSCRDGVIGQADGDETWESTRQIPTQSKFIEGNGYWGDDLNRD
jgi:hypothetical protein